MARSCSVFTLSSLFLLFFPLSKGYVVYSDTNIIIERVADPVDHGEGPHWDSKTETLYYVNTFEPAVIQLKDGVLTTQIINNTDSIGTVTPIADTESKFLLTCDTTVWILDWDGASNNSGLVKYQTPLISDLEPTKPNNQANDGKSDDHGRFWIGTLTRNPDDSVTTTGGSLFLINNNGTSKKLWDNITISNGLAWNSNKTKFYFIDSRNRTVSSYDYNSEDGTIDNWNELFKLSDYPEYSDNVIPDGMAIDSDDNLWVALFRGSTILHVDSETGNLIGLIEMPVSHVTAVVFGGKNLDTLYVTTSRHNFNESMLEQQPYAGSTYAITGLGVTGTVMNDYKYGGDIQQTLSSCISVCKTDRSIKIVSVTEATCHGEGPHWDHRKQALYYVNTFLPTVFRLKNGVVTYQQIGRAKSIGTITPIEGTQTKFLITCDKAVWVLDWDGEANNSGSVDYSKSIIDDLEPDKPRNQANDGKADTLGRLWIGTLTRNPDFTVTEPGGSLYIIDEKGVTKLLLHCLTISNGIAWSKDDKKFFFVDSAEKDIKVFDSDIKNGTINNPRKLFQLTDCPDVHPSGIIDGITIDCMDNLWIAIYRGGLIFQIDGKNGTMLKKIEMPVSGVTSLAFGGPNFDILYATTSRFQLSKEVLKSQPESGKVFAITGLGVAGTPMNNYVFKERY